MVCVHACVNQAGFEPAIVEARSSALALCLRRRRLRKWPRRPHRQYTKLPGIFLRVNPRITTDWACYLCASAGRRIRSTIVELGPVVPSSQEAAMRRSLPVAGAFLLAGGLCVCGNTTQESSGQTQSPTEEYKITPEDIARKNPMKSSPEGLAEARRIFKYDC